MKKALLLILGIGIILRIFLSFSTYHSDTAPFDFAGTVIKEGNITNFYDYLWDLPDDHPYLKIYPRFLFNYPPLPYFFLGGFSLLTTWLVDPIVHQNFITNFESTLGNPQLNLLLLLLKLPYFIFDIAIAYILMAFFKDKNQKLLAFGLWMFNPITLYSTYMIGQFDVIPTFLSVLALYYVQKESNGDNTKEGSYLKSAVLLGLGASFKIFPLLFILPLAFIKKDWTGRIKILLTAGLTYLVTSYPFILSDGFRRTAMLASQTTKSFYAQIPISGGESIILFLAAVIFLYILFFYKTSKASDLWKQFFIMILVFFIFTHYHPQWFLWTMPFFVIDLVLTKLKHWPLVLAIFVSHFALVSFFDPGLSVWLFAPINPILYGMPGIWQQLGINLDINVFRSIFHTIFVGVSMYYIYYYFPKKEYEN